MKLYKNSYLMKLTFPRGFLKNCNNNGNLTFNIPTYVKNNLKQMSMEKGFYAQVVNATF